MGPAFLALSLALAPHFVNENIALTAKNIITSSQNNTPAPAGRQLLRALHTAS